MCASAMPEDIERRDRIVLIRSLERYPDSDDIELYRKGLPSGRYANRCSAQTLER